MARIPLLVIFLVGYFSLAKCHHPGHPGMPPQPNGNSGEQFGMPDIVKPNGHPGGRPGMPGNLQDLPGFHPFLQPEHGIPGNPNGRPGGQPGMPGNHGHPGGRPGMPGNFNPNAHPNRNGAFGKPGRSNIEGRQYPGDEPAGPLMKCGTNDVFGIFRLFQADKKHTRNDVVSRQICDNLCDAYDGMKSYFYDQPEKVCHCFPVTLEQSLTKAEQFGAPKSCSGAFRRCRTVQGHCKIEVDPMVQDPGTSFTAESCTRLCSAEPSCMFWIFDKKKGKCQMYSQPQKQCNAFLGMTKRAKAECEGGAKGSAKDDV